MPLSPSERKNLVKSKGLTHRTIAEAVGIDTSAVTHIIAGRKISGRKTRKVMQFIAEATGLSIGDLFDVEVRKDDVAKAA